MWKTICSAPWHWMPSTVAPADVESPTESCGASGIGTPSGPMLPAAPGADSDPSELSGASAWAGREETVPA
jgi:hypothetical protein